MLKLSASRVGTYEKCPKKYFYGYIEKPDIEKVEWPHLEFGSCAHRILEIFHETLVDDPSIEVSNYPSVMKDSFKNGLKEFRLHLLKNELPYLQEIMQDYLNIIYKDGLPEVVGIETPFEIEIGGYIMRGFIDRIDRIGPGKYEVVDYKTSKSPRYLTSFQLLVYALAIKEIFPDAKKVNGSYCLLKHKCKSKSWEFTELDYKKTIKKITCAGDNITGESNWIKKPTPLCDWCDFQKICMPKEEKWA